MAAAYGLEPQAVSGDAPGGRVLLYLPGGAEGLRWNTLSEIEKPDSGTEPIHQEHVMCSRFRGSCPSDVKSAVHPEPGFPISLSVFTAALCAPREIQKNPAARSVPVYRPRFQALSGVHRKSPGSGHTQNRGRTIIAADAQKIVKIKPKSYNFHIDHVS